MKNNESPSVGIITYSKKEVLTETNITSFTAYNIKNGGKSRVSNYYGVDGNITVCFDTFKIFEIIE